MRQRSKIKQPWVSAEIHSQYKVGTKNINFVAAAAAQVVAVAQIQSLAREFPYATGEAIQFFKNCKA